MRRNYCWLAILAAWTILPILRNPLAQEEPRGNPAKRFIDKNDIICAASAARDVLDGKSSQGNGESYREEIHGRKGDPTVLSKNLLPAGEIEATNNARNEEEVNARGNSHSSISNDRFRDKHSKSIGKFEGAPTETTTRNAREKEDSNEVKKNIDSRKPASVAGRYDPELLLKDTRFSISTRYGKMRSSLRNEETADSWIFAKGKYRRDGDAEEKGTEESRFLVSTGNTDDSSTEREPRRTDSTEMPIRGEPRSSAWDDESRSKSETAESPERETIRRAADCGTLQGRNVRIRSSTGKSRIPSKIANKDSYLHGTKLKMSSDDGPTRGIERRGNLRRKRSLPADVNCRWVIANESSESKALGSSRIFRFPIKNRMDEPSAEDNRKSATPEDARNPFYRRKEIQGNVKHDFLRPTVERHRYIGEPQHFSNNRDTFLGNSSNRFGSVTSRDITTRSESTDIDGSRANHPPGEDSQSTSAAPPTHEHNEEAGKKWSFTLTNHSRKSIPSEYNSEDGVFRQTRFDEKQQRQPAIELDSIAVPSNFIAPQRVVAGHQHSASANINKYPGNSRQREASVLIEEEGRVRQRKGNERNESELREGGSTKLSGNIDGRQNSDEKYSDATPLDADFNAGFKSQRKSERNDVHLRRIPRGNGWQSNATTKYQRDFSPADNTSSSAPAELKDNPTRVKEQSSPLKGEVSHRKSRIRPARYDEDNRVPISPQDDDETEASIYTANSEKNGLTQVGEFQREVRAATAGEKTKIYRKVGEDIGSAPRVIDSRTSVEVTNRPNNSSRLTSSSSPESSYTKAAEVWEKRENAAEKKDGVVEAAEKNNATFEGMDESAPHDASLSTVFPFEATGYARELIVTATQDSLQKPTFSGEEETSYPASAHGTLKQNTEHAVTLSEENPRTSKLNISGRFLTAGRESAAAEVNAGAQSISQTTSEMTSAAYSRMHFSPESSGAEETESAMKKPSTIEPLREDDGETNSPELGRNRPVFVSANPAARRSRRAGKMMITSETKPDGDFLPRDGEDQETPGNRGNNNLVELADKYIRLRKEGHLRSYERTNFAAAVGTRASRTMVSSGARSAQQTTANDDEPYQSSAAIVSAKVVGKRPLLGGALPETFSPFPAAFHRARTLETSLVKPKTVDEEKPDGRSIDHHTPTSPPLIAQRSANDPTQLHESHEFPPSRDFVNYRAESVRSSEITTVTGGEAIIHLRGRFEGPSITRGTFINNEDVSARSGSLGSSGKKCRTDDDCPSYFIRSFARRHAINSSSSSSSSQRNDHSSTAPFELTTPAGRDSWRFSNQWTDPPEISSQPFTSGLSTTSRTDRVEGLEDSPAERISTSALDYRTSGPAETDPLGSESNRSTTTNTYSWFTAFPANTGDVYSTLSSNRRPIGGDASSSVDHWRTSGDADNSSAPESTAVDQWPVKHSAVVEGDLVLGGLMMVHEREDTITCGPVMPQGGVQALEAMLYTLDKLNDRNILPGVKIGAHILDDCDKDTYGLEMAVDFIKGSISNIDGAEYHCNRTAVRKVISGVVGAASSVTSIQVANLLRLFRIPQVSFFSTSPELSNKQRFEYFTRTIPSDHYQVKAMVDIVRKMGWSYISIIYEESNYGIKAFEELEELLKKHQICIAIKEKLVKDSGVAEETAYDNIVLKLLTKPRARGCIIFGSDQEVAGVMRAVRRCNATGAFSWIGSDGWSARGLVSDGNEPEVEGTLSVQPQANPVRGFEEYFLNLTVENNRRNPWFVEFWEDHFQCRYPNASLTPYNKKYTRVCTTKERLTKQNTAFEDQLQFVSDAVMAFAYAFRDMHRDLCGGKAGLCEAMKPTKGTELLKYLRKVDFEGLSGDQFKFDKNGDGPARYNIIHFKQTSPGKYKWIRVGKYLEGELRLNMSEVQFKLGHRQPPESVCSLPCEVGQAKKYVEGEKCCWHCFNCTQYQIRDPDDETQCIACRQGTVPDETHSTCRDIPEEFLRPESGWAIGAMSFSATGILVTLFVVGVFLRHNDTPVVRASGRELSYVLLSGILLCYLVTFALVLRPTDIVCGIQRFAAGFCFTVVYAALLTKTNRILRIFNASKRSAKRPSFISPRSQLIICSGLVGVQILINGVWMVIDPARAMHHYPTREDNLLVCNSYIDASYMIAFTYPIILIVVCTVYAVLTRKTPEAFNESKHIGFTMYTTCVIWLAFVPLYFGTGNHVALRITSMSVTISLSASVTIACLFSPKLYIILIRPERNVRQSMMPTRYSTTKNSAMSGTNASSTLGHVALASVTRGQNEALKKHVRTTMDGSTQSEHHELEMISKKNGKVPAAAVVTRSTQTQTNNNENGGGEVATVKDADVKEKKIARTRNGPIAQNDVPS